MSLVERIRNNQLDLPLAALQLLAFISTVALVIDAVLLYRHFTDDALTPALTYLLSLKLAFPPFVVIGATYLYAFSTGESVSEAPKSMWRHVKNNTLHAGNCTTANSIYSQLSLAQLNAGTEGNRVAALVNCRKSLEAATVGTDAIKRLQGKPEALRNMRDFVSLLTNTGFTKLINEAYQEALEDMQAAHDLIPDQMAKQNLALALIGVSRSRDAIAVLEGDSDAPPVSTESQLQVIVRNGGGSCSYLISALALATAGDNEQTIFANVLSYARRPQPPDVIGKNSRTWKETANGTLQMDKRPCGNLALLPLVTRALK